MLSYKALNGQTEGVVLRNQIVIGKYSNKIAFFRCAGSTSDGSARFTQIVATDASVYERNQTIDKLIYNEPKGFDSTAWQKLYDSNTNEEIYLNIASLNSVVPEFQVSADPPTSLPDLPHFSANSGGVFYDLHMQPQWGFRVGQAEDKDKSDEKTKWIKHSISSYGDNISIQYYNEDTEKWRSVSGVSEEEQMKVSADIYYNAAGFDPLIRAYDEESDNHINVLPTGSSENKYVTHGSAAGKTAKDIQELRISLPIIGNIVCKLWDLIHGENRDDSETTSLQGRLNSFNNLEENAIPVVKGNIISSGKLQGDTWITPHIATNDNDNEIEYLVMVEHNNPDSTLENLTTIGGNDSEDKEATLNFGEGIVLPRISYDKKGHIQSSYEFNYTLPSLSLVSKENNEGEILSDLSFESVEGEGKFTKTYSYVGDLSLKGYDLADSYEIVSLLESDNVNTAFAKLQYQINTKTSNDETKFGAIDQSINNVNGRIDSLDYTDTTENNKYVSAVNQADGVISVSKVALPEIYNSSVNFTYGTEENKQNIPWLFEKAFGIEAKADSALTAISNMDYNDTWENSYVSGITQTDGKINVSYTVFPNIYNAESLFSYGEESETTMTIPSLFTTVYNLSKAIDELDYVETNSNMNEYVYSVSQDNGKISCLKTALPEIYNSSTTFKYTEGVQKTIGQWFELVKELEEKINTLETQLTSANNQITNLNNAITNLTARVDALENPIEETPPVEEGGEETPTE